MKNAIAALLLLSLSFAARAGELAVVELSGSPYQRGLTHGRTLKPQIAASVAIWKKDLAEQTGMDADALIAEFLHDCDFIVPTRRWTPEMIDEVRGIADGSGESFDTMWTFQLLDELWVYLDEKHPVNHCSSLGVPRRGSQPAYVAQNMDIDWFYDGYQTVLHIKDDPEQFIFTTAGVVALNGINDRSIGVVVNTLSQLRPSREGLPVAFVIRGILAKRKGGDALAFVKSVRHASGQNYIVGTGDRVYDFEASGNKVVQVGADGPVCHTNHALANDDRIPNLPPHFPNSEARLQSLLSAGDDLLGALKAKPVCRPLVQGKDFTFGSTIMTLSDHPSLQVSAGPPDVSPYRRFEFRK